MWKFLGSREQGQEMNDSHGSSRVEPNPIAEPHAVVEHEAEVQRLMQQAELCLEQSPEQSLELLQQALDIMPNLPQLWEKQGIVLQKLGRYEEAIAANQRAMQLLTQSIEGADSRSDFLELQNSEQVVFEKNTAVSLPNTIAESPQTVMAKAYFQEGYHLSNAGRYEEAIACYDKVLQIYPDDFEAWCNRGDALNNLGRYDEALDSCDNAIQIKPDQDLVWINRGYALYELGRYEEAIDSCDNVIQIKPDHEWAWINRGYTLHKLGRYEEAIASLDRAIEIKPDHEWAWINRGYSLEKLGRYEEAIASYDEALKINPDSFNAWSIRGNSLYELGRYEEAIASCDQALKIKPDFDWPWNTRGLALDCLGCDEDAIASYDKATQIKPNYFEAWVNRGNSLYQLGHYEEAIASYDKAIEINPDYDNAWINRSFSVLSSKFSLAHISALALKNENLKQRGYPGQILTLQEGIKAMEPHSVGWGKLHQALGNAHFQKAKVERGGARSYQSYLNLANSCFQTALGTFQSDQYKQERLELYQNYLPLLITLKDVDATAQIRRLSLTLLRELLNKTPLAAKQRLEAKFSGLSQIAIDSLIVESEPILALEAAERYKNRCLTQLFNAWQEQVTSPSYAQMRRLLAPNQAIISWHLSPETLTTFILVLWQPDPIVFTQPASDWQTWQQNWDQHYNDYRSKGKQQTAEKQNHPWRSQLKTNLETLTTLLNIEQIETLLPADATLILSPHRDLHRFPIHTLFPHHTSQYLPSLQVGLSQKSLPPANFLLNVQDPQRPDQTELTFAALESAIIEAMFAPQFKTIARADADLGTVQTALQTHHGIFHFTGHSEYQAAHPETSALGLANQDQLLAKDIAPLNLSQYSLVCLSSCETALTGTQTLRQDYIGLASAFLQAGVSQVISTCWTVPEISSTYLMIRFYQVLQQQPAATALHQAQTWLRQVTPAELAHWLEALIQSYEPNLSVYIRQELQQQAHRFRNSEPTTTMDSPTPPYADPYHWAAFTLTGRGL